MKLSPALLHVGALLVASTAVGTVAAVPHQRKQRQQHQERQRRQKLEDDGANHPHERPRRGMSRPPSLIPRANHNIHNSNNNNNNNSNNSNDDNSNSIHDTINCRQRERILTSTLCNASTISSTYYSSNHTVTKLGTPIDNTTGLPLPYPPKIRSYLEMNKFVDKSTVAKMKVVETHFCHNFHELMNEPKETNGDGDGIITMMMKPALLAECLWFVHRGFVALEKHRKSMILSPVNHGFYPEDGVRVGREENNNLTIVYLVLRNSGVLDVFCHGIGGESHRGKK